MNKRQKKKHRKKQLERIFNDANIQKALENMFLSAALYGSGFIKIKYDPILINNLSFAELMNLPLTKD